MHEWITMLSGWLHDLVRLWFGWVHDWGYGGVVVLMAMESSIFPVPSEVVIPPAVFWASKGTGGMTVWGVILAGTVGSYLGSAATYWISRWLGRVFILKWGKRFLITEEKVERAERFVHRYEAGGVFFARLLPVMRHLISIPAGIVSMGFRTFSLMTIVGAALWCGILAWFSARVAERNPELMEDPQKLISAIKHESLGFVAAVLVLAVLYALTMKITARKAS
jgi:membrane protein DedA with SNARE-associated domain